MAQTKPLNTFAGYSVERNATTVTFGCGAVKVARKDLLAAAELVATAEFKAAVKLITKLKQNVGDHMDVENIMAIPAKTFRALAG